MRLAGLKLLAAAVLFCSVNAASAADYAIERLALPSYDVDLTCKNLQYVSSINDCIRDEQSSYKALKYLWPGLQDRWKSELLSLMKPFVGMPFFYKGLSKNVQLLYENDKSSLKVSDIPDF